jgi:hypothetical protein
VAILLGCGVGYRLFMVWPKINPHAKPTPRIITCTVWAGCVHEPDRTFTEIVEWKDPKLHLFDFFGIQRKDDSLTQQEWERFTQSVGQGDREISIKRNWGISIPRREQNFDEICPSCYERTDLYLLGKPNYGNPSNERWASLYFIASFKLLNPFQSDRFWLKGAQQIFVVMRAERNEPMPSFPFMAMPDQKQEILKLHFLRSPYGACAFMNQHTSPIHNLEEAILLKQTFEKLMGWQFVDEATDRLKELISLGSTLQLGQPPVVSADLEVEVMEEASGWVFRGPLRISDGPHSIYEKIYHRCALRVNRDGTVSFQHLKELVEKYPGYQ